MVSFPYSSHIFRDSYDMGNSMGPNGSHNWGSLNIPLTLSLFLQELNKTVQGRSLPCFFLGKKKHSELMGGNQKKSVPSLCW